MKEKNEKKLSYGTYSLEDTAKKLGVIPQTLRNWMIQIGLHNPVPKKYSLIKEYPIEVSRSALNRLIEYKNFKEKKIKVIIDEQASTLMGYASRSQLVVKLKKQFTKFNPERYKSSFFFTGEEIAWGIL